MRTFHVQFRHWGVWLLAGTLLSLGSWWLQCSWTAARLARVKLEACRQERQRLGRQMPALTDENNRAILRELAEAERIRAERLAAWSGPEGVAATSGPSTSLDGLIELAAYAEKMRTIAAARRVQTRPGESFGFSSYRQHGPEDGLTAGVRRQRLVLTYLVEGLLQAGPDTLLSVQRRPPRAFGADAGAAGNKPQRKSAAAGPVSRDQSDDFFEPDATLTASADSKAALDAYRLEFSGTSRVLRDFLNRLASEAWPVAVRRVEVGPVAQGRAGTAAPLQAAAGSVTPMTLVPPELSRFVVVVELVKPADLAEGTAP